MKHQKIFAIVFSLLIPGASASAAPGRAFEEMGALAGGEDPYSIPTPQNHAPSSAELKEEMLDSVSTIRRAMRSQYTPAKWKEKYNGVTIDGLFNRLEDDVRRDRIATPKEFRARLQETINAFGDYHLNVRYSNADSSTLPFVVKRVRDERGGQRWLIAWVDEEKAGGFPFKAGDELVTFGGRPVGQVAAELQKRTNNGAPLTGAALADMGITARRGDNALSGPVEIGVKPYGSETVVSHRMDWKVRKDPLNDADLLGKPGRKSDEVKPVPSIDPYNPMEIGGKWSFVPRLGKVIATSKDMIGGWPTRWLLEAQNPNMVRGGGARARAVGEMRSDPIDGSPMRMDVLRVQTTPEVMTWAGLKYNGKLSNDPPVQKPGWELSQFDYYMYESPVDGRKMGYVRIPEYAPRNRVTAAKEFAKIINMFNSNGAEGLVIDEVNNPGGSVAYLYALASMLTDKPLKTTDWYYSVTKEVARSEAAELKENRALLARVDTDEELQRAVGVESIDGYPLTIDLVKDMMKFSRSIVGQWRTHVEETGGESPMITPEPAQLITGTIVPSKQASFTKPIMILVNELDFSGGDFFPAIMQDNKRAVLFGVRTSGAGGHVESHQYSNGLGISGFTLTASLARRLNGHPIEGLGVSPDIKYEVSAEDLRGGFAGYAAAVNKAMARVMAGGTR